MINENDFTIDRFNLELEAERNAELMRRYGKLYTIAMSTSKIEKRKLNYTETEIAQRIRSNPSAFGINGKERLTDKFVFGLVQNEPEYVKQFNKHLTAVRLEEDYKNAIDVCRQRGMMIRVLTDQWINNYYAKPIVVNKTEKTMAKRPKRLKLSARKDF